jgi:drug/metabolite transporter (DMT)-like permease
MESFTNHQKGILSLILLAFGFGAIAITARYLSFYYTLYQQLYVTIGVGFLVSLIIFPKTLSFERLKKIQRKEWVVMVFRVIVGYVLAGSLYRESITLTKISNVTFIQSIPIAGILGWILFKEKFTYKKLFFLAIAYVGVLLIAVKDFSSVLTFGRGELLSLISTLFFALSYVSRKWQTDLLTDKEIAQILLGLGTFILFLISLVKGEGMPVWNWEFALLLSLFFTGFFNAINIFFINYGFNNVRQCWRATS